MKCPMQVLGSASQGRGDACQASLAVPQPGHHGQSGTAAGKNSPPNLGLPDLKGNQLLQQPGPSPACLSADTGMVREEGTGRKGGSMHQIYWDNVLVLHHGCDVLGEVEMLSLLPRQETPSQQHFDF